MDEMEERIGSPPLLQPCPCCGRTFVPETLVKHQRICEKNAAKERKTFDTSKQRLRGLGLENIPKSSTKTPPSKKNNWRQKHEDFIDSMRSAREVSQALKTGAPLPPPVSQKAKVNPDYLQCPHCSRHFNESAAERHIPWCKEQNRRIGTNTLAEKKKEQLNTRTKYKPPLPGAKKLRSPKPRSTLSKPPVVKRTSDQNSPSSVDELDKRFSESATVGRRRSGTNKQGRPTSLVGLRARSNSLERPIIRKPPNSMDSLRRRNYSEDDYDDSTGDENGSETILTNGYHYRNSHILPHHKVRSANSDSPLSGRTPTPPSSRKSSIESVGRRPSKFCYECGTKYPVPHAKYCCECGTKRPYIE